MTRCTHLGCRGSMMVESVDTHYQGDKAATTEAICLSCGRSPGDGPDLAPRLVCVVAGCQRTAFHDGKDGLCLPHRAASKRHAAGRERSGMTMGGFG